MRRVWPWCPGAIALGWPLAAQANAGVGLFSVAVPFTLAALVPAILVEAPVFSRMLGVGWRRGLWWSLLANLVSTVAGAILAVLADFALLAPSGSSGLVPTLASTLSALLPMFLVTWWLETITVRALQPAGAAASPRRAALVANVVSYALLVAAMFFLVGPGSEFPRSDARSRIGEVLAQMGAQKTELAEHFATRGEFPAPRGVAVATRYASSLRIEEGGRIVARIHYPGVAEVDGAQVSLVPRVESRAIVSWECHAPRSAHKFLPASCRQEEPASGRGP